MYPTAIKLTTISLVEGGIMTQTNTILLMIVDDHDLLREGLKTVFSACEDITVVGEATNGRQAIERCEQCRPNVILIDLDMPQIDGIETIRVIHQRHPDIYLLAFTSLNDKTLIPNAFKAGAATCLLKNSPIPELVKAIRDTVQGKQILVPEIANLLIRSIHTVKPDFRLTRREKEVLRYLVEGLTNDQIAKKMVVSSATAKKHVGNILAKLHATSRTHAVVLALELKLLE
jgi:two-component system, NarL family, response regulator LiaR